MAELSWNLGYLSLRRSCLRTLVLLSGITTVLVLLLQTSLSLDAVLAGRAERVKQKCLQFRDENDDDKVNLEPVHPERFFYMKDPGFAVCMVPKVASTSLSRFLIGAHQKFRGGERVWRQRNRF